MRFFSLLVSSLFLAIGIPVWAAEPPADTDIISANECIKIQKSASSIVPTKVRNTCDEPVAFSDWFCGTETEPCSSKQDSRWNEDPDTLDRRGGINLLCPRSETEWKDSGYDCLPVLLIWRTGIYAYGACYLSEARLEHWTDDVDSARESSARYIGDTYNWHDACERWLTKKTREIAEGSESPVKEGIYFDLSPPPLYRM